MPNYNLAYKPDFERRSSLLFIFLILLISISGISQVNLNRGLLGHWPLNGNVNDVSGNNRNGSINGNVIPAPDRFGKVNSAIELDGNGSYVVVPDNNGSLLTDKFSVCAWFQSTSSNVQTVIGKVLFNGVPINEQVQLYINWPVTPGIGSVIIPNGAPCNLGHQFAESRIATGEELCRERWYFMVVTFDAGVHRVYLDGKLMASRNTGFSQITKCIGDLQFGAWWNGDRQYFKGFIDEVRVYNRAINADEVNALYGDSRGVDSYDFSFLQDICNPLRLDFFYNGPGSQIAWDFEPGKNGEGTRPQHTFSKNGEYPVRMVVAYNNCKTNDTLIKNVNLKFTDADLIMNKDTVSCSGAPIQLKSNVSGNFCWFPKDYMINENTPNPTVNPLNPTTYYLTYKKEGVNLVVNGDFSNGNSGFTTTYLYRSNNTTEGEYFVSPFPQNWNGALSACNQPNGTSGNMLLVNGVPEPNKVVWSQEINVNPNKTYDFSLFIAALYPVNPALLQFSINNAIIGDSISANPQTCNWKQFITTWNSGSNTKAVISIINKNTEIQGNDFGIDNITFREINFEIDSVKISLGAIKIQVTNDTAACIGSTIQLKAEGASTYVWSPSTGLNNPSISNPVAIIEKDITYFVKGISAGGCEDIDSVKISAKAIPVGKVIPTDVLICGMDTIQIEAQGGIKYEWAPSTNMDNANLSKPTIIINGPITYRVKIFNALGCIKTDSVVFSWRDKATFGIAPLNAAICMGDSITLTANGGDRYDWRPNILLGSSDNASFIAKPIITTEFKVKIWDDVCNDSTELSSVIIVNSLPVIKGSKSNDITCDITTAQLNASGGNVYSWFPITGLSDPVISNPVASPKITTVYKVKATDVNGCSNSDSLILAFVNNAKISVTKDTSICQLGVLQLNVAGAESYKWSPSLGLNNPDIPNPVATVNGSIKYRVTGTTISGCMVIDSVQINELPLPIGNTYADRKLVCGISDVQLTSAGGVKYEWSPSSGLSNPNISNPITKVESLQIFKVKITGVNGCFTIDSVTISWKEKPVYGISPITATVCSKDTLSIQVIGGDKFLWEPAQYLNTNSGSRVIAQPITDTDFRVKVWDTQCNDSAVLTSIIKVNPGPSITVTKSNDITCDVVTTQLNANGAISYQWQPASGLSAANIANPVARPNTTTTFNVTAKDGIGCTSVDSVTVFFNAIGDGRLYQMPTAFTPNGDGLNDCFGIGKWGNSIEVFVFEIYNRWGQKIFSGSHLNKCWNGDFNGKRLPSGNYLYIIKAKSPCGEIYKKGGFVLIR